MKALYFRMLGLFLLNVWTFGKMEVLCAQANAAVFSRVADNDAATSDSLPNYRIGEVLVTENKKDPEKRSSTPFQWLNRATLREVNALQVSDAVRFFSGVTVKDYGGIGGMKTLSVRSMGAHHTAVAYDGITITDSQTGQIDIGRYSLENVDVLSLNIGDGNTIFQPARMFASSGLLNIRTRRPVFEDGVHFHGKIGMKAGSFGLLNPALLLETKLSPQFDLSFSAEALSSDGDYPYRLFHADDAYTKRIRTNNEVKTCRLESTLFGHFQKGQQLEVKAYYYQSYRGLPGAVILYNPYSSQYLWDKNAFLQAHYEQDLSKKFVLQVNGKYNWSYQRYLDPDYLGSEGREDNTYNQYETYLSSSLLFKTCPGLSFAFSADGAVNGMQADLYHFASPARYTALANLSAKYLNDWMLVTAGILGAAINEERKSAAAADDYHRLSPAFSFSVRPFPGEDLHVRMFYKASFRMPSFNDLYYTEVGNSKLKPENSRQLDLGLTYSRSFGEGWPLLMLTSDIYYNRISDKIVAMPTNNIFIWSMVNLGKVDIRGIDLNLSVTQSLGEKYKLFAGLNHSYQRALDVTDATAREYKNQIAYAPRIFGSGRLALETPWMKLAYAMIYSGHRYLTGQNLEENDFPGFTDHSVSVERNFTVKGLTLNLRGEVLNVLNENYEIVRNFPMPGRAYRVGVRVEF